MKTYDIGDSLQGVLCGACVLLGLAAALDFDAILFLASGVLAGFGIDCLLDITCVVIIEDDDHDDYDDWRYT